MALRQLRSTLLPTWRLVCLLAGLASLWLAIASPLDAFASFLLTVHMIQHMLLMLVAPPLILLGFPQIPLLRGLPLWAARDGLGPFLNWAPLKHLGRALTHPAFCWLAATVVLLAWHIPAAYDLALTSPVWHGVEHACLFGASLLFWWPVIEPWPSTPHWPRWSIPAYLLAGDLVTTALAAILCFSDRPLYPAYAAVPRLFGWTQLNDQVAAGALMWVFGSAILLSAAVVVTLRLLDPSPAVRKPQNEANSWSRSTRPSRPPFDLLRVPIIGSLLRSAYGRRALQATVLLVAVAVIVDGFVGHRMGPMNLAGVVPWTYGRALVVAGLLTAGNFFCMACPFTLPREAGRRLGIATRHWPRALRTKWLAVGLLVLFFWAYDTVRSLEHSASHRLHSGRLFRDSLRGGHLLPRRHLLQVRLPDRPVQFRQLAGIPAGGQDSPAANLHHLRGSRLSARQRASPRLRASALSPSKSGKHGLHVLPGLRKGLSARQHRYPRRPSRT